ncbi:Pleckstrin homology-like domain-containing protein [Cynara cardunculus var. scolymus]|uniref:Pleckstrin homology-like domain-containing protein n=2 Tax=Cynara cardunculus var. scolymus TaxID=59895 RepID=A0A124SFM3_CYNCS|nr:Pleckstrin homology-like domain-containing protein [Cynara cardunculus var. scolymus]
MINRSPNWVRGLCIGRGSFGTVSLAVDKSDGRRFAVKSVEETSGRFSQALENEIRILKSLSSPYVVEYLGDDFTSELSSVVYRNLHMEYMPGGTVADMAEQGEDATVRNYTRCVVSALSYIHRKNIVHCDVKGKNVLIGENPGAAKLADFGSAVEMSGPISGTRGSPLWMAPEVVRGEYQGPESDIWSLGCTVIEMVTGKPAWEDRGIDTLCQIGYSDELPKLPAHFSDELRDFLHKCLRRNPSERWSSDQLLQHPFLSSCSSSSSSSNSTESTTKKLSPRCVFDWSDSNFSDEETSEMKKSTRNLNSSDAKRRMGILSCNSAAANWESDGWELVRNAAEEGGPTSTEEERSWQEDGYSDEEGGGGFDDDDGGANNHADVRRFCFQNLRFHFAFCNSLPSSPSMASNDPEHKEEETAAVEDEDTGAQVAPIVKLEEVAVTTGEENEDAILDLKAKLYRFDKDGNQWKERGAGSVKFLKHKQTGKVRLVMRQSKTLKICANHLVIPTMSVQEHAGNDKSCVWHATDFSDGELKDELFCIRFGSIDNCKKFMETFQEVAESQEGKEENKEASGAAGLLEKLSVEDKEGKEEPKESTDEPKAKVEEKVVAEKTGEEEEKKAE